MNWKRIAFFTLAVTLMANLVVGVAEAQQRRRGKGKGNRISTPERGSVTKGAGQNASTAKGGVLSQVEVTNLSAMLDEEKLAHDVYVTLQRTSGRAIFTTIAAAETRHMNALRQLAIRHQLKVPAVNNTVGQFRDPAVRELYRKLVVDGSRSALDAVKVGAKIEEMDIADLTAAMSASRNPDVLAVYGNLQRGSRNHLRAFSKEISGLGGSYVAQHLSQAEFDRIASSAIERGGKQGGARQQFGGQGQSQGTRGKGSQRGGKRKGGRRT